jgi:hypothetical protein
LQSYSKFITDDIIVAAIALGGGGSGATKGSCGVFSGGLMALSATFCPRSEELSDQDMTEMEIVRSVFYEFRDWFIKEFSGATCSDVQRKLFGHSYNLKDEAEHEELRRLQEKLGFDCGIVIEKTAIRVAEMLTRQK